MRKFFEPADSPQWLKAVLASIRGALGDTWPTPLRLQSFAKADLPAAADYPSGLVTVSNETGGFTVAFSDGTNWRRVQDRAVVS